MRKYRLGLHPPEPATVALKLNDYFDHQSILPKIPENFGHANALADWGMLGNGPDSNPADIPVGDCAYAGPEHIIMGWQAAAKKPISPFTYASTMKMYTLGSGYDPSQYNSVTQQNPTDQGGDMSQIAELWQTTGFTDAAGTVHKIGAYLALEPGNLDQLAAATFIFDAVGVGLALPSTAEGQFENGEPWSVVPGATDEGGHFVAVLGREHGNYQPITWARPQPMTPEFYQEYGQLAIVYLPPVDEFMDNGFSPEHFDMAQLTADLAALNAA